MKILLTIGIYLGWGIIAATLLVFGLTVIELILGGFRRDSGK